MTERDCPLCRERGKTWEGSDPVCAFTSGGLENRFSFINWNCATMNKLRNIAEKLGLTYRDNLGAGSFGALPFEGPNYQGYIVMTWYKNRGKTDNAILMCYDEPIRELTLDIAMEAIQYWENEWREKKHEQQ